ncbi:ADP-ribosylation factor-like protein [Nannocystis pusilla]|uniref:ADP-ribosylation factor-like protein n=1 Tax=Nannocystis pusilla TaxID=889268 RepID=UPI003DA6A6BD
MAVFEPDRARIVLRIVYDGPGRAGKTTNVEQLARIFGTRPGDELQVHPAATGRTIFFDWFSFDGGVLDGQQLQVQVVTVPGHKSLEPRRAHILRGADVVVLVCDSAVSGQDSAREMLDSLREHLGKSAVHVPLLVQANKQDLPSAMLPHELGAALRLGPDVPVIGAQASAGIGVRETAVGAIRAAVRQMKQRTAREGLGALAGQAGTAEQLRAALQTIESVGAHRSAEDEARRASPRSQPDEGRVVYIRSAKRTTPLAGDAEAPVRPRAAHVSENMSERPASERPARLKVPVSAMFVEPTPHVEPPDIPSPPAPAVRVPPPPVLGHADAPIAVTEPFDPEEARDGADAPAPANGSTFVPTSLRDRWPTEPQPLREEPPDAAAPPRDADEAAPSSAVTHDLSPEETLPAPGDDREPSKAASPTPELAPTEPVPEDSLSSAPSESDREHAAATPPAHVPEDSPPSAASEPDQEDAAATPPSHDPEDSRASAPPVQEDSSPAPLAHVSEDGRDAESRTFARSVHDDADHDSRARGDLRDRPAAPATASPAHVPADRSAAATPAPLPEADHPPGQPVLEDSSASPAPRDARPPDRPAQEDNSAMPVRLVHVPGDRARRGPPGPHDSASAPSPSTVLEDSHAGSAPDAATASASSDAVREGSPSLPGEKDRAATTAAPAGSPADLRSAEPPAPAAEVEAAAIAPARPAPEDIHASSSAAAGDGAPARPVPEDIHPAAPPAAGDTAASPVPEDISTAPVPPSQPVPEDTQLSPTPDPEPAPVDLAAPRPDLPPGHVWPVPAGRHVLERIAGGSLVRARPAGHAPSNMLYKTGGFCLRTRPEWRFGDDERGRAALREHVRRAARLGPLLPADTAVALAVGDADHVLWHIVPDLPALGAELRTATGAERPRQLARLASAYATALRLGAREGLALDLDAHAFAEQGGRWVYLGDRLGEPAPASALIHALLRPPAQPLTAWLDALDQVLPAVLTRDNVAALGLHGALASSEAAPEARLRAILERCA